MSPYLSDDHHRGLTSRPSMMEQGLPYINADPLTLSSSLDPFTITTSTGFMPLQRPLVELPSAFHPLVKLLEAMPIAKLDGSPGLLATYELGPTIDNKKDVLPDLSSEVDNLTAVDGLPDLVTVTAVFRDYAFLASAYLLEPCWERWNKGLEGYGLGRQVLPKSIAGPLVKTAKLLDIPPFMSYAAAYSLFNYRFVDASIGTSQYGNLRLIRAFEHGLDPASSEAGFVLTHVDMVKYSPGLIDGTVKLLDAIALKSGEPVIKESFALLLDTMQAIEGSMETMWAHSKPKDYNSYRTFIFGITNQSMFPQGVIYEGQHNDKALFFRGESGANDSMIPLLDSLLQIPMPQNPLTDILKDFRSYRPKPHREFLAYVRQRADELSVRETCCKHPDTAVLYLHLLDHVRSFRWRHWLFAREYIIRRSSHPTATGGSPIVQWLPNQLFAVMDVMAKVWDGLGAQVKAEATTDVTEIMANVHEQREKLGKEVQRWCQERKIDARV